MKSPGCWICRHYCQKSHLVTPGHRNVSGGLAVYRIWDKHRCSLQQENKYPNDCDFELNREKLDELNKKHPDLAAANVRIKNVARKVVEIKSREKR